MGVCGGKTEGLLRNYFPVPLCLAQRHLHLSTLPVELVTDHQCSQLAVFALWPCKPWEEVLVYD